ncbi:DUF952 domain-containing protein [Streptomyces cavernicola]|uniref:DUF952 domain-containing protein n=1 Tax=Streptomyces cavernicola TaxID=3043613 RepID=A0ABT6S4C4_9ACTN|nr:DUF952 domain-containing protein [Streptomyces sp. B-S-A6]MDI3402947.1 DUF952 domain-containing protein [Streptomyces sp. B-S-A6]
MIHHVVTAADWAAQAPDGPYAPVSLERDGFVHCAPDEPTALAVVNAFYGDAPRPLLALLVDEDRLTSDCRFEPADGAPPPGVAADVLFPHVYGPLDRAAVVAVREVQWDPTTGRATGFGDPAPANGDNEKRAEQ